MYVGNIVKDISFALSLYASFDTIRGKKSTLFNEDLENNSIPPLNSGS